MLELGGSLRVQNALWELVLLWNKMYVAWEENRILGKQKRLPLGITLKSTPVMECLGISNNWSWYQIFLSQQYVYEGTV